MIAIDFAQHGVPIDTIARALAATPEAVKTVLKRAIQRGDLMRLPPSKPIGNESLLTEIANLRAKLDDAEFQLREYRKPIDETFNGVCGLTFGEAQLVGVIVKHGRVNRERAYEEVYTGVSNPPTKRTFDKIIDSVRPKLKAFGIVVKTHRREGWEISPEDIAKLRQIREGR